MHRILWCYTCMHVYGLYYTCRSQFSMLSILVCFLLAFNIFPLKRHRNSVLYFVVEIYLLSYGCSSYSTLIFSACSVSVTNWRTSPWCNQCRECMSDHVRPFPVMAADCRQVRHGGGMAKLPTQQPSNPQVQGMYLYVHCVSLWVMVLNLLESGISKVSDELYE